jgi:hypothetical protein
MGIQINGNTDTITAIDGALTVSGAELSAVTNLNATGIVTATGFVGNITGNLNSSGVSTFTNGPVLVGSGSSTGTASQRLQVTGGAYVSDNLGIGLTNPFSKLDIRYSSSTAYSTTASPQTVNAITLLNTNTTATTTFSGIALGNARNGNTAFVGIECVGTGNDTTALAFKTQSAGPVFAEAARIDSSGNFKLSVAGTKILNSSGNPILQQTGSILQVVHTQKTNSFSGTSTQTGSGFYIDVTGLSATITPTSTNSKILILTNMYIGKTTAGGGGYQQHFRIKRNGTAIILGDGEGGRPTSTGRINTYSTDTTSGQYQMTMFSGVHYDSPASTSALTYQIALGGYTVSPVVYVNRSETWQNLANDYDSTPVSTLTLMEVSA